MPEIPVATVLMGVIKGAIHLSNVPNPVDKALTPNPILPIATSIGPSATTNIPVLTTNFFCQPSKSVNHLTVSFTPSTMLVNALPRLSPVFLAHSTASSDFSNSINSPIDSLDCSNTPPKRFSPMIPMYALVLATIPAQDSE